MFTTRLQIASGPPLPGFVRTAAAGPDRAAVAGRIVRAMALSGLLWSGLSGTASAQTRGTMQVAARVVPAAVAWAGVAEAGAAARSMALQSGGPALTRRNGLVQARAEVRQSGRRLLVVTIHHPHN